MKDVIAKRVATLKPSGIRKFFDVAATMKGVISLGIGEPDFPTPPPVIQAGVAALERGETHYTSNAGLFSLREAVSTQIEALYGVRYDPATEILITVGVSEALSILFRAILELGDEVIIPTPCFVAYQAEVLMSGGVPVEIPCTLDNDFEVQASDIEAAITPKTKAIFISSPNNPTGAVISRHTMEGIAKLVEEHELLVISDEIYDRLVYSFEHVCFSSLPGMRERTILLGGFSKAYAMTGWRVGYICAPEDFCPALLRVHQYSIMSAPTVSQFAALEALRVGEPYVQAMVEEYDRRRRLIVKGFNSLGMPTFVPRGAFYAFPRVDGFGMDEDTFCNRLLQEEKVAMVPGTAFGDAGAGHARASYATSYESIEEALTRIERFLKRQRTIWM